MKQIAYLITTLSILVGLSACDSECPVSSPTSPSETTLTVTNPEISLKKGQKAQIQYAVTPQETSVSFVSDAPEIVSVNDAGEVSALLVGQATITLTAKDKTAKCVVTVQDETQPVLEEMPLLKFSAKFNKELHITDAEILAYEKALGRVETSIDFNDEKSMLGFANTNLSTITGVIYGLRAEGVADIIVAYSKESFASCDRTKAMLRKLGFTSFKETLITVDNQEEPALSATNDKDPDIAVLLYNDPKPKLSSILYLQFSKKIPPAPVKTRHAILPDAQDFPSLSKFATLDVDQIKGFEESLGIRSFDDTRSQDKTLYFNTREDKIAESNIEYVCYMGTPMMPPAFITCRLLCVSDQKELESEAMKTYLKNNGFDQRYEITKDADKELHVYNASGDQCIVAIRTYDTETICVMSITLQKDL